MILKVIGGFFMDIIETSVAALSIFLVVYLFLMQPHQVNGNSMYPSFEDREYLMTDKISYRTGDPKRGDIVVFHAPPSAHCPSGTGCDFIKRVIGLPGEVVEVTRGQIYLNNQPLAEEYLPDSFVTHPGYFTSSGPVVVPPGEYFVVGDNRNHSSDSRAFGFVPKENIVGKVFFRYWPLDRMGGISAADYDFFSE
ncbi:signal peptidase I [Patescibacteria group bacterium]